jgi:hypothetical protein
MAMGEMTLVPVIVIYERPFASGEDSEDFVRFILFCCCFTTGFLPPTRILRIFFPEA